MKKAILLTVSILLTTTFAFAHEAEVSASSPHNEGSFFLGFSGGADLPGLNWSPNYTVGGGAQAFAGYAFDKNIAVQIEEDSWFFEGASFSLFNLRTLGLVKYTANTEVCQPYILAGGGMVYQVLSTNGSYSTNIDALGGLGAQFDLSPNAHYFVEARYNFILPATGSFQDVPLTMGIWVSLP